MSPVVGNDARYVRNSDNSLDTIGVDINFNIFVAGHRICNYYDPENTELIACYFLKYYR